MVVIGLVVAAIANLIVTVIPDDKEDTGKITFLIAVFTTLNCEHPMSFFIYS